MKTFPVLLAALAFWGSSATLDAAIVYNSIPSPLAPNVPSQAFEAWSVHEFGNAVNLTPGGGRVLDKFSVVMSNWAKQSEYLNADPSGFTLPITLSLYEYGAGGEVGALFATQTLAQQIQWRPEPSPGCGTAWLAGNGNCYNGRAQIIDFDFASANIILPDRFIFKIAYNTQHYGAPPTGVPGPYNSLNVGLIIAPPLVGSNPQQYRYLNSSYAGAYYDGGAPGAFRLDAATQPYTIAARIETVPEPSTAIVTLFAGLALSLATRRRLVKP